MAARAERAVGLKHDAEPLAGVEQPAPVLERAELHLVDDGCRRARRDDLVKVRLAEVGDADGGGEPALPRLLHPWPGPQRAALRPVHQVQVDLVDPEPPQALLKLRDGVLAPGVELRGDEHLAAVHAAVVQRLPHARLVAIGPVSYTHLTLP